MVISDDDAVTHHTDFSIAGDLALKHIAPRDRTDIGDLVDLPDFGAAQLDLAGFGGEHPLHSGLNIVDRIVDDPVEAQLHAVPLGVVLGHRVGPDVEPDDDRIGSIGEHDIALRDCADRAMDHLDPYFVVRELLERLFDRLDRTLYVGLDDDRQFLHVAL